MLQSGALRERLSGLSLIRGISTRARLFLDTLVLEILFPNMLNSSPLVRIADLRAAYYCAMVFAVVLIATDKRMVQMVRRSNEFVLSR